MKLHHFTTETNEDGTHIVRARGLVAVQPDRDAQLEWIEFQVVVDVPTVRNGALLRQVVLRRVIDQLRPLAEDFQQIGEQARSSR